MGTPLSQKLVNKSDVDCCHKVSRPFGLNRACSQMHLDGGPASQTLAMGMFAAASLRRTDGGMDRGCLRPFTYEKCPHKIKSKVSSSST